MRNRIKEIDGITNDYKMLNIIRMSAVRWSKNLKKVTPRWIARNEEG